MSELITKSQEEINQCIQRQFKVCQENLYPHFAPQNGICFKCNRNIYQNYNTNRFISCGYDGSTPITGCPHCRKSYCD